MTSIEWDEDWNVTLASSSVSYNSFERDALGRASLQVLATGGSEYVLFTPYNALGERVALVVYNVADGADDDGDFTNIYGHDALSRVESISQHPGIYENNQWVGGEDVTEKYVEFDWHDDGRLEAVRRYADDTKTTHIATSSYAFDGRGRISGITHDVANETDDVVYAYLYDNADRITQMTRTVDTLDWTADFDYDRTGQLIAADYTGDHPLASTDEAYSFDQNGNRVTANGDEYQTGKNNELDSDGTYVYTHDSEGNRIEKRLASGDTLVERYTWDHRNRLTKVEQFDEVSGDPTQTIDFQYDAFNRRIAKLVDSDLVESGYEKEEWFVYDGQDVLVVHSDALTPTHRYLHGPLVDQVLAEEFETGPNAGDTLWHLADHQGTVRELVDHATREIVEEIDFDAFGNILAVNDTPGADPTSRYAYTGREYDAETGLNYHRNRYLDLANGVWISEDPIGFAGGQSNLVMFISNSAPNGTDAHGEWFGGIVGGIIGGAVGAVSGAINGGVQGAVAGFIGGAVGGAVAGALLNPAAGIAAAAGANAVVAAAFGGAVAGGVGGAAGNVAQQAVNVAQGGKFDPNQVAEAALVGAVLGGLANGALAAAPFIPPPRPPFALAGAGNPAIAVAPQAVVAVPQGVAPGAAGAVQGLMQGQPAAMAGGDNNGGGAGAGQRGGGSGPFTYEPSPKHGSSSRGSSKGRINPAPKDPQNALDGSVRIGPNSTRRVGVDCDGNFVVFDETYPGKGVFHGHTRTWSELEDGMRRALIDAGITDRRGRILQR